MPVHDHEVHERVKSKVDTPYGCSNATSKDGYWVRVRLYDNEGKYVMANRYIPDRMSDECRYDKRPTDPKCGQCQLPSDEEYLRSYGLA